MDVPIKCSMCRYWEITSGGTRARGNTGRDFAPGICRRFPPRVFTRNDQAATQRNEDWLWPVTVGLDWCGEFETQPE